MKWTFDQCATAGVLYSRAIMGDLCAGPLSPLTATAGIGAQLSRAWRENYHETGTLSAPTGTAADPVRIFGARVYLDTSLFMLFGAGSANADPSDLLRFFVGSHPDVPRGLRQASPATRSPGAAREWARRSMALLESARNEQARCAERVSRLAAGTPRAAGASSSTLVSRIGEASAEISRSLHLLVRVELASAVAGLTLMSIARHGGLSEPAATMLAKNHLSGAAVMDELWSIAGVVERSRRLELAFDQGVPRLAQQLSGSPEGDLGGLTARLRGLCARYGHLGPEQWELSSETWGSNITLPLAVINNLRRRVGGTLRGYERTRLGRENAALTARLVSGLRRGLRLTPTLLELFDLALAAAGRWQSLREQSHELISALHQRQRVAATELGRRGVESGVLDSTDQVFMLMFEELDEFVAEPGRLGEEVRMRGYDFHALASSHPPPVSVGQPLPSAHWLRTGRADRPDDGALGGTPAGHGVGIGPAAVLDAGSAATLRVHRGDVLVLPSGNAYWVPVLPLAAGVVVEDGSVASDVAAACRYLSVPCVAATGRIRGLVAAGSRLTVDGTTGAVRRAGEAPAHPAPDDSDDRTP